jgi:hypothetical protein
LDGHAVKLATAPYRGQARVLVPTLRRALFALLLRRYLARAGVDEREVAEWRLPVIAARLADFALRP